MLLKIIINIIQKNHAIINISNYSNLQAWNYANDPKNDPSILIITPKNYAIN